MARARLLKIGFFENEVLAQRPPIVRLTYAGLWLLADREGKLEDRPVRIRAQLFPYDATTDVDDCLRQLAETGFIERYTVNGVHYLAIPKFLDHQSPHMREAVSKIPAAPRALGQPRASPGLAPGQHQSSPAVSVPETVTERVPETVLDPDLETVTVSATKSCSEQELRALVRKTLELTNLTSRTDSYKLDALQQVNKGRLQFSAKDALIVIRQELDDRRVAS